MQNLGRWGPHIKNCFIMIQNPKSKIPKIRALGIWDFGFWILGIWDFGFWILGILDFGLWGFWILAFGILGIWDFGFWGFWILDFGILGILDFGFWGFWGVWILDFGTLGILDFGFWGFWGFWILDFGILGRSRGCTTRQFRDGAWRSQARIRPGLPFGGHFITNCIWYSWGKKANWIFFQRSEPYKIQSKIPKIAKIQNPEAGICSDLPWGPLQNQLYLIELARIPSGLPLGATSKPTVSDRVGARKQIEYFFRGQNPTKYNPKSPKSPKSKIQRLESALICLGGHCKTNYIW